MNILKLNKSKVIDKVFYNRKLMKIVFQTGRTYNFRNVPRKIFEDLKKADSAGTFFNKEIKGKYIFY